MTPTARTSISAFPRSHEFAPSTFVVTPADVAAYLAAIGDAGDYGDAVPPLAAVALGLAALQEQIALPDGSLHTGQEVDHEATVHVGETLTLRGRIAQRSERQGYVITVLAFDIGASDITAIQARTTIMAPAEAQ